MVAICSSLAIFEVGDTETTGFAITVAEDFSNTDFFVEAAVTEPPMNLENYSLDFMIPSNISAKQLEKVLKKELKPLAKTFVEIEEEYGINSLLFSSLVALESGWGTSNLSQTHNNITSNRTPDGYTYYPSKEACLYYAAENLANNYFAEDGIYYDGNTALNNIACYYLLGKPESEINSCELKTKQNYVNIIEEIYFSMVDEIKHLTD